MTTTAEKIEIAPGWRLFSCDFSIAAGTDSAVQGRATLVRDPKHKEMWHKLPEELKELDNGPELYVYGKGFTIEEAIEAANQAARHAQPIKPPDPEPLECWLNTYIAGIRSTSFETEAGALRSFSNANSAHRVRSAVHMREVTPQDEQDRKDARRYRGIKENLDIRKKLLENPLYYWDEMIDKAMKE